MKSREWYALLVVAGISVSLNLWNNTFPIGYHGDEPKKVRFVLTGEQDFHHPILLLQLTRLGSFLLNWNDNRVVLIGRTVSAVAGAAVAGLIFLLARRTMSFAWTCLTSTATAVSPILVIHAHYLKEDVLFTACALATLWGSLRLAERPTWWRTAQLGCLAGLAFSSHYKSALLGPIVLVLPLLIPLADRWSIYLKLLAVFFIAELVFLTVNSPLLHDPQIFLGGLLHEKDHIVSGHDLRIPIGTDFFAFYYVNSLGPGMTWLAVITATLGAAICCWKWRTLQPCDWLMLLFAGSYYLAAELAPSKPEPDYGRYILPVAMALIYLGCRGWGMLTGRSRRPMSGVLMILVGCELVFVPLIDSVQLDSRLLTDTRVEAQEWLNSHPGKALSEQYAAAEFDTSSAADYDVDELIRQGYRYVVTSDFRYHRYEYGSQLPAQDDYIYSRQERYERLFSYPYVEFRPRYRSYAFSNPTIRIVDVTPDAEEPSNSHTIR